MKKAQAEMLGPVIVAFMLITIGIILVVGGTSSSIGSLTNTYPLVNSTKSFGATGSNVTFTGIQALTDVIITNKTNGALVTADNYTVINYFLNTATNTLEVRITNNGPVFNNRDVNISGTYETYGYLRNAGDRSITGLIVIFGVIIIAITAMVPALRSGVLDMIKR